MPKPTLLTLYKGQRKHGCLLEVNLGKMMSWWNLSLVSLICRNDTSFSSRVKTSGGIADTLRVFT